jgi:hypothetical protein
MLVRRKNETLTELLTRLDFAIGLALTGDIFTDEVNQRPKGDVDAATCTAVTPESVNLELPSGYLVTGNLWDATGAVTASTLPAATSIPLTVTDKLLIRHLVP